MSAETSLSKVFHELAESLKRRALVVILSDLFDDPAELVGALKHFRHKKHEVVVLRRNTEVVRLCILKRAGERGCCI